MVSHLDVIRASDEAFNAHDVEGTAHACVENFTYTDNATGETFKGVEEFKAWLDSWFNAFPDTKIDEGQYIAAGDVVVHQSVERATNKGPLGPLPATGRSVSVPFCEVWRLNAEGRADRPRRPLLRPALPHDPPRPHAAPWRVMITATRMEGDLIREGFP